jgi:hypothetical protein
MQNESINAALVVAVSAVYEALPKKTRRKVSSLIDHTTVDDPDARRLLDTFRTDYFDR